MAITGGQGFARQSGHPSPVHAHYNIIRNHFNPFLHASDMQSFHPPRVDTVTHPADDPVELTRPTRANFPTCPPPDTTAIFGGMEKVLAQSSKMSAFGTAHSEYLNVQFHH